jgi:hypothetical protein
MAFAQGGVTVCSPETKDCFQWTCPAGTTCCPRPHDPNIHTICPSGDCCNPCSPTSSQCQPDGYCGPGPVAKDCACPEEITDLARCPDRVQREPPTVNGCGGEGVPPAIIRFLNRFKDANFEPACNAHDKCYGTCRNTQKSCDDRFLDDLQAICQATYGRDDWEHRSVCLSQSRGVYYRAVRAVGRTFYEPAQRKFCRCCPDSSQERPLEPSSPRPTPPETLSPQDQDVKVRVSCLGATPCAGTLGLSTVVGAGGGARGSGTTAAGVRPRRKMLLGQRAFSIAPGRSARVRVPLSRKGRRLLRKRKRLTVLATTRIQLGNGERVETGLDTFVLTAHRRGQRR